MCESHTRYQDVYYTTPGTPGNLEFDITPRNTGKWKSYGMLLMLLENSVVS